LKKSVNQAISCSLLALIQQNHGLPKTSSGETSMNKLVAALIAGLFATSVYAQTPAPAAPAAGAPAATADAPAPKAKKTTKAKKAKKAKTAKPAAETAPK
jgi:hypothetical protein